MARTNKKNMKRIPNKLKVGSTGKERTWRHRNVSKIISNRNKIVAQLMSKPIQNNISLTSSSGISVKEEEDFEEKLIDWIDLYNISKRGVNRLLSILNSEGHSLPRDYRTLLRTDTKIKTVPLAGGMYWHNGLKKCLLRIFGNFKESAKLSLNFNIDGLPIYKSSKETFWPILANLHDFPKIRPIVVGIWSGEGKPVLNEYLEPFVNELLELIENGLSVNGHNFELNIRAFICDSPARAYIKGT